MFVRFLVLDTNYYDGTKKGIEKAFENAEEITVSNVSSIEEAVNQYRCKYPADRYDFDDFIWR